MRHSSSSSHSTVLIHSDVTSTLAHESRIASWFVSALFLALTASSACCSASAQTNEWAWMGGSNKGGEPAGVYGQLGVAAPGNTPGGRDLAIHWTDANGNLWLFGAPVGGYDVNGAFAYLDDVWEFDTSTQEWVWMAGSNSVPATGCDICAATPVFGTFQTPAVGNTPGTLQSRIQWVDKEGDLWIFGGFGYQNNITGAMNALWEFSVSTHEWAWMGGSSNVNGVAPGVYGTLGKPAAPNTPGGRVGAASWVDSNGDLWLFGGAGQDSAGTSGYLNDLWMFNPSINQWTWMGGSNSNFSGPCLANDTYWITPGCVAPGEPGTLQIPAAGNIPQGRNDAAAWTDTHGNVWIFGGDTVVSYDINGISGIEGAYFNDLWELNSSTYEWTWMSGDAALTGNAPEYGSSPGVYGTLGTPSANNTPGGREGSYTWTDSIGNLWLFGGNGFDSTITDGNLNDLWMFDASQNEWAWMGGSSTFATKCKTGSTTCSRPGVYGSLGTPAASNAPGARYGAAQSTDQNGNVWLFGGWGVDANGIWGYLNDLWEFTPATSLWTWMGETALFRIMATTRAARWECMGIWECKPPPICREAGNLPHGGPIAVEISGSSAESVAAAITARGH